MKTLLIDDHPLILSALQLVIQGLDKHVSLVSVETAQKAREALAADSSFDLVLLDLRLGDADGFDLLKELREVYPALSIVIVSASDNVADILRAIELGAMGFIPKRASNQLLFDALTMVMSGGIYVPPMEMRSSASAGRDSSWGVTSDRPAPADDIASLGLTRRQTEVLMLLLRGQSNKLIARELNLSVETIKDHVAAVLRTLNVSSRTQAVLAVSQMSQRGSLGGWRNGVEVV
jgi:DNA-binding NarL/FixJ family response regulator